MGATVRARWVIEASYEHVEGKFVQADELAEAGVHDIEVPETVYVEDSSYDLAQSDVLPYPADHIEVDPHQVAREFAKALKDVDAIVAAYDGRDRGLHHLMNVQAYLRAKVKTWTNP